MMYSTNLDLIKESFNLAEGERRKEQGMQLAADTRQDDLSIARDIARMLNDRFGKVDADMVQDRLIPRGINLGNAAGSIFKTKEWVHVGYTKSRRKTNHARVISVWTLA